MASVICVCGRVLMLPEGADVTRLKCPSCTAALHIPSQVEDKQLVRWFCSCGQRLKTRGGATTRSIKCPKCGVFTKVPVLNTDTEGASDAPLEVEVLEIEDGIIGDN